MSVNQLFKIMMVEENGVGKMKFEKLSEAKNYDRGISSHNGGISSHSTGNMMIGCSRCNFVRQVPTGNTKVLDWFLIVEGKWVCKPCHNKEMDEMDDE